MGQKWGRMGRNMIGSDMVFMLKSPYFRRFLYHNISHAVPLPALYFFIKVLRNIGF